MCTPVSGGTRADARRHLGYHPAEVDGYSDRVLANTGQCTNPVAVAGQRVGDSQLDISSRFEQGRWAYLFGIGRITENEVMALADKVWP